MDARLEALNTQRRRSAASIDNLPAIYEEEMRVNRRADAFPVALGIVVLYHLSVMTFYRLPAWIGFGNWFVGLPLS